MSQQCVDPIVGKILAGWRYDISGLAPEMCGDYESTSLSVNTAAAANKFIASLM